MVKTTADYTDYALIQWPVLIYIYRSYIKYIYILNIPTAGTFLALDA